MTDRTVHATTEDGRQIVRYNRAGKWYAEGPEDRYRTTPKRRHIDIHGAVQLAMRPGSTVHRGLPGGTTFDAKVRDAQGT